SWDPPSPAGTPRVMSHRSIDPSGATPRVSRLTQPLPADNERTVSGSARCASASSPSAERPRDEMHGKSLLCAKVIASAWADGTWRSLVAHLTGGQGVAGSNPAVPTGS